MDTGELSDALQALQGLSGSLEHAVSQDLRDLAYRAEGRVLTHASSGTYAAFANDSSAALEAQPGLVPELPDVQAASLRAMGAVLPELVSGAGIDVIGSLKRSRAPRGGGTDGAADSGGLGEGNAGYPVSSEGNSDARAFFGQKEPGGREALRSLVSDFLQAPEAVANRVPFAPSYATAAVSRALIQGQPPVSTPASLVAYLAQDLLGYCELLRCAEAQLVMRVFTSGVTSMRFWPGLRAAYEFHAELVRLRRQARNTLSRLLAVSIHAHIALPEQVSRPLLLELGGGERLSSARRLDPSSLGGDSWLQGSSGREGRSPAASSSPSGPAPQADGDFPASSPQYFLRRAFACVDAHITQEDAKVPLRRLCSPCAPVDEVVPQLYWAASQHRGRILLDTILLAGVETDVEIDFAKHVIACVSGFVNGKFESAASKAVTGRLPARSRLSSEARARLRRYSSSMAHKSARARAAATWTPSSRPSASRAEEFGPPSALELSEETEVQCKDFRLLVPPTYPLSSAEGVGCVLALGDLGLAGFSSPADFGGLLGISDGVSAEDGPVRSFFGVEVIPKETPGHSNAPVTDSRAVGRRGAGGASVVATASRDGGGDCDGESAAATASAVGPTDPSEDQEDSEEGMSLAKRTLCYISAGVGDITRIYGRNVDLEAAASSFSYAAGLVFSHLSDVLPSYAGAGFSSLTSDKKEEDAARMDQARRDEARRREGKPLTSPAEVARQHSVTSVAGAEGEPKAALQISVFSGGYALYSGDPERRLFYLDVGADYATSSAVYHRPESYGEHLRELEQEDREADGHNPLYRSGGEGDSLEVSQAAASVHSFCERYGRGLVGIQQRLQERRGAGRGGFSGVPAADAGDSPDFPSREAGGDAGTDFARVPRKSPGRARSASGSQTHPSATSSGVPSGWTAWHDAVRAYSDLLHAPDSEASGQLSSSPLDRAQLVAKYVTTGGKAVSVRLDGTVSVILGLMSGASVRERQAVSKIVIQRAYENSLQACRLSLSGRDFGRLQLAGFPTLLNGLFHLRFVKLMRTWADMVSDLTAIQAYILNSREFLLFAKGEYGLLSEFFAEFLPAGDSGRAAGAGEAGAAGSATPSTENSRAGGSEDSAQPRRLWPFPPNSQQGREMERIFAALGGAGGSTQASASAVSSSHSSRPSSRPSSAAHRRRGRSTPGSLGAALPSLPQDAPGGASSGRDSTPGSGTTASRGSEEVPSFFSTLSVDPDVFRMQRVWQTVLQMAAAHVMSDDQAGLEDRGALELDVHERFVKTPKGGAPAASVGPTSSRPCGRRIAGPLFSRLFVIEENDPRDNLSPAGSSPTRASQGGESCRPGHATVYLNSKRAVVFRQAINDANAILRDDHIALSTYADRVVERVLDVSMRVGLEHSTHARRMYDMGTPVRPEVMQNHEIFDLLDESVRKALTQLTPQTVFDYFGSLCDLVLAEAELLRQKLCLVRALYEGLLQCGSREKAEILYEQMCNEAARRPEEALFFSSACPAGARPSPGSAAVSGAGAYKTIMQEYAIELERLASGAEREQSRAEGDGSRRSAERPDSPASMFNTRVFTPEQVVQCGLLAARYVPNPAAIIRSSADATAALARSCEAILRSERSHAALSRAASRGEAPRTFLLGEVPSMEFQDSCMHLSVQVNPSLSLLSGLMFSAAESAASAQNVFLSETQPKLRMFLQAASPELLLPRRTVSGGDVSSSASLAYSGAFLGRLTVSSRLAVARVFARETLRILGEIGRRGPLGSLAPGVQALLRPGLLALPDVTEALADAAILVAKRRLDGDDDMASERTLNSMLGLLLPVGGGYLRDDDAVGSRASRVSRESLVERISRESGKPIASTFEKNLESEKDFGPLAGLFGRSVSMRDVYLQLDRGTRHQARQLISRCPLDRWEGYPNVLPLSFSVLATTINLLHARCSLVQACVEGNALRKAELAQALLGTGRSEYDDLLAEISGGGRSAGREEKLSVFRTVLSFSREPGMPTYKDALGIACLLNPDPLLVTMNRDCADLVQAYSFDEAVSVVRCLVSNDSLLDKDGIPIPGGAGDLSETLRYGNMGVAASFPLFSPLLKGPTGMYSRIAFIERALNSLRTSVVRSNQPGIDFAILSMLDLGLDKLRASQLPIGLARPPLSSVASSLVLPGAMEQRGPWAEIDCGRILAALAPPANQAAFAGGDLMSVWGAARAHAGFNQALSTQYYRSSEDVLSKAVFTLRAEYDYRLRSLGSEAQTPFLLYGLRQSLAYTLGSTLLTETQRFAHQAQIRGLLTLVRDHLSRVDQDKTMFIVEPAPMFRGLGLSADDSPAYDSLFLADGRIGSPFCLPHPVSFSGECGLQVLELMTYYLQCLDSIVRGSMLKVALSGGSLWEAGTTLEGDTHFISEIARVSLDVGAAQGLFSVVIPTSVYLSGQECEGLRAAGALSQSFEECEENLEYCKLRLLFEKCTEARDKAELLSMASCVQAINSSRRKGLLHVASDMQVPLQALSVRQNAATAGPLGTSLAVQGLSGQDIYAALCLEAQVRALSASCAASPLVGSPLSWIPVDVHGEPVRLFGSRRQSRAMPTEVDGMPIVSQDTPFSFAGGAKGPLDAGPASLHTHCAQTRILEGENARGHRPSAEDEAEAGGATARPGSSRAGRYFIDEQGRRVALSSGGDSVEEEIDLSRPASARISTMAECFLPLAAPYAVLGESLSLLDDLSGRYCLTNALNVVRAARRLLLRGSQAEVRLPLGAYGPDSLFGVGGIQKIVLDRKTPPKVSHTIAAPSGMFTSYGFPFLQQTPFLTCWVAEMACRGSGLEGWASVYTPFGLTSKLAEPQRGGAGWSAGVSTTGAGGVLPAGESSPATMAGGSLTDYYFPRALLPGLAENEEALLSAALTTIELDALCISNTLKADGDDNGLALQPAGSPGASQAAKAALGSAGGSNLDSQAHNTTTSAWTVKQTSLLISSLILTQDKAESQFLCLHGSDPHERESVLLSPIAVLGPAGADAVLRRSLMRKLQKVRQEERALLAGSPGAGQPRSQSPFRSRPAQPLGQIPSVPPRATRPAGRQKPFEYLETPVPAKALTAAAVPAPVATLQHAQAVQSFSYLLLPSFLYMDERPAGRVFLPADVQDIQALLPVLRAAENLALGSHIRTILLRRLARRVRATTQRLEAGMRLNFRETPPADQFYGSDGIGQAYVNFLLNNGEGSRLAALLNELLVTQSHASPFSESSGQSVSPSILTSLAMALGVLPHLPDRAVVAADESTSYTIKLNAASALSQILASLPSAHPPPKQISTIFAGLDLASAQRVPTFTERGVLEVAAARLLAGLAPFLAARVTALLKQGLRNARLHDAKSYLHGVMPIFLQVQDAMPEYSMGLVPTGAPPLDLRLDQLQAPGAAGFTEGLSATPSAAARSLREQVSQELFLFRVSDLLGIFNSTRQQLEFSLRYLAEFQAGFRHGVLESSVQASSERHEEIYSRHAIRRVGVGMEVRRRALAGLRPAALEYAQDASRLVHGVEGQARFLCLYESFLRETLHREMGRRTLILLDSIKLARRQKLLIAARKNQIIREAVEAARKRYEPYLATVDKLRKNGELAAPDGLDSLERVEPQAYGDFRPTVASGASGTPGAPGASTTPKSGGPDVLSFYRSAIEALRRQREETTIRLLATRHFDNFRAAVLRDKLKKTSRVVGGSLVTCARDIWGVLNGLEDVDASLGRKLAGEQAMINETASRLVEMRAEVETYNSGPNKRRLAAASAKVHRLGGEQRAAQATQTTSAASEDEAGAHISVSGPAMAATSAASTATGPEGSTMTGTAPNSVSAAYASLARRILPSLRQKTVSESAKACTDAENKLILLRRKVAEKEALERDRELYISALEQVRKQAALRQRELKREIASERRTQDQASARLGDLRASVASTQAAARTVQMNTMVLEEEMRDAERERLQNEIDVAAMEAKGWEDKIAILREKYAEVLGWE